MRYLDRPESQCEHRTFPSHALSQPTDEHVDVYLAIGLVLSHDFSATDHDAYETVVS